MGTLEQQLGMKVARHRKASGLTQAQLAEEVGVQPETISRIETGSRLPSLDLIAKVSTALKLDLHELFRFQDLDDPQGRAIDRLLWFASRLSGPEIELMMDVVAPVLAHLHRPPR